MTIDTAYQNFSREARIATVSTVAATLLFILPIIVMVCALVCLRLPGVNVAALKPALIPSAIALAASVPLIVLSVIHNRRKNAAYLPYIGRVKEAVDDYRFPDEPEKKEKKEFQKFLLEDLLKTSYSVDFRFFVLSALIKKYEKGSSIKKALEKAKLELLK